MMSKAIKGLIWALALAAGTVLLAVFLKWQNYGLAVSGVRVEADIPEGVRILHLSDLHGAWFGGGQERIADEARSLKPDVIVITGDFIDAQHDEKAAVALIESMAEIAPTYCVTGNHEANEKRHGVESYERLLEAVEHADNAHWLCGETIRLCEGVTLTGADDIFFLNDTLWSNDISAYADYIAGLREAAGDGYSILLAHRPEMFEHYAAAGFNLTLSGHAHGGQIRLPLIGGLFAPGQGILPEYTGGLYEHESGAQMHVSCGLGNSAFPQRLFNRPDMTLITVGRK